IHVPQANNRFGSLDDFFAEPSYIPLQTTPESLIGSINRLYFFDGRIYVLDKKQNAVLIFDQSGAFLSKVQRLGRGPGEYQSVMDFTIDRKQKHLLLYADRPYKLLTFEMDGTFLEETRLVGLFFNIAMANDRVQVFRKTDKELVSELDHGAVYRTLIPFDAVDLYFRDFFIPYPSLTTDKKVNILPPYSDTVYTYTGDSLAVSYVLDFGERRRQLGKEIERKTSYQDVYTKAMEEDLGFPVFGFRESDRFVSFTFGLNNIVIYDKTSKEAYTTKVFRKEGNPIWFKDYFAHDGEGDFLVSICQPTD